MTTRYQLRAPDHTRIRDAMLLLCAVPCWPGYIQAERVARGLGLRYDAEATRYAAVQLGVTIRVLWLRGEAGLGWASDQDYRTARRKLDQVWRAWQKKQGATDVD